ncbi:AAA family ATPase [Flavobacterium sp.]|uniref:AAA family ATPase n=1 Tax=Flavobacterium sp. TaxID=239 RepID=UPI003752C344
MKISKLHIDQFRHLENLDFDFTYPEDFHIEEKRGKPLDKICFIGQSATGKTGLLELIKNQNFELQNIIFNSNGFSRTGDIEKLFGEISFEFENKNILLSSSSLKVNSIELVEFNGSGEFDHLLTEKEKKSVYYFKANLISDKSIDVFTKNPIDLFEKYPRLNDNLTLNNFYPNDKIIIFGDDINIDLWLFLLNDILVYRKKFNQKMSELIHKGLLGNPKKLSLEFEKWQKENPNKLELFAEKFNPLLEKLNLEVDVIDTEYSIPIRNKINDLIVPIQNTSTGTKGLLLSFLPLFKLDTKDSIILIDEPERSLYPDMQMDLMEYYQNLAPEAQYIIATHSPFIAASFEPEERFILYFDKEGKVAVRRGSSPIGDDPNDLLKNDFGVNYYNKFGKEAYKKYLKLKEDLSKEKNPTKKKELLLETVKLGDTYNF